MLLKITWADWFALVWFIASWAAYAYYADNLGHGPRNLTAVLNQYRWRWFRQMLKRENRVTDSSLIGNLVNSVSFFASTTIFIIAGLITVFGYSERAIEITADLPFAKQTSRELWELKLLLLLTVFIYAFFKFTYALRHFNILTILVGGAPEGGEDPGRHDDFVARASRISEFAGEDFTRGVRAYYFGLAALTWFVHPVLFVLVTVFVVLVLYRRDFHSPTLRALQDSGPEPGKD
ncbi:MAG: DUF599 family protein [Betaproteobacteria bacterium]|nr:DUF599 family protein [Betaproteobacteria bacterium]